MLKLRARRKIFGAEGCLPRLKRIPFRGRGGAQKLPEPEVFLVFVGVCGEEPGKTLLYGYMGKPFFFVWVFGGRARDCHGNVGGFASFCLPFSCSPGVKHALKQAGTRSRGFPMITFGGRVKIRY